MWIGNEPNMTQTDAARAICAAEAQRDCGFHWKELCRLADRIASHVRMLGESSLHNYEKASELLVCALDHGRRLAAARLLLRVPDGDPMDDGLAMGACPEEPRC